MENVMRKNRKKFGRFLFTAFLLYAVFCLQPDIANRSKGTSESRDTILRATSSCFSVIANAEEITLSASQASLLHQTHSQKNRLVITGIYAVICNAAFLPVCVCLSFLYIFCKNIGNSQRYIIKYIHNIDGEKA